MLSFAAVDPSRHQVNQATTDATQREVQGLADGAKAVGATAVSTSPVTFTRRLTSWV